MNNRNSSPERLTVEDRNDLPAMEKTYDNSIASSSVASSSCSRAVRANLYAQELNNSAVSCIEVGQHGRAVTSLTRSLELYKRQKNSKALTKCNCYECSLDGCIVREGKSRRSPTENAKGDRARGCSNTNSSSGYISRRPIKVNAQGHTMGPALYLIIAYNLGLAYHLLAIGSRERKERGRIIQGAIASYNLAYEMQMNLLRHNNNDNHNSPDPQKIEDELSSLRSIRFKLMILNNKSQLHKLNRCLNEHDRCLRLLMSTMMVVLDQQVIASNSESSIAPLWRIKLDGFLRNTASLVLLPEYTAVSA